MALETLTRMQEGLKVSLWSNDQRVIFIGVLGLWLGGSLLSE